MNTTPVPQVIARGREIRKFQGVPVYEFIIDDTGTLYDFDRCLPEALYDDDVRYLQALSMLGDDEVFMMPGIVYKRVPIKEL